MLRYQDTTFWTAATAGGMIFSAGVANLVTYYAEQLMELRTPIEDLFFQEAAVNFWTATALAEVAIVVSATIFLVWIYKVYKNAAALGGVDGQALWAAGERPRLGLWFTIGCWMLILITTIFSFMSVESLSLAIGAAGGEQKRQLLMNGLELCTKAGYLQSACCVLTACVVYSFTAMLREREKQYLERYCLPSTTLV
jgi:hypothetical protein